MTKNDITSQHSDIKAMCCTSNIIRTGDSTNLHLPTNAVVIIIVIVINSYTWYSTQNKNKTRGNCECIAT